MDNGLRKSYQRCRSWRVMFLRSVLESSDRFLVESVQIPSFYTVCSGEAFCAAYGGITHISQKIGSEEPIF